MTTATIPSGLTWISSSTQLNEDAVDNVTYLSHIFEGGVALERVEFGLSKTQLKPEGGLRDAG